MATNKLTDRTVKNAKGEDRTYRLTDGDGMFLEIRPDGAKYWRLAYRFAGKQKQLAMGVYDAVSLAEARTKREDARKQIQAGTDPGEAKKAARAEQEAGSTTFEDVSADWYAKTRPGSKNKAPWSERHAARVDNMLKNDLLPVLGKIAVDQVRAKDIITALDRVEARGALHTIGKVKGVADAVMAYAVGRALAERNPARDIKLSVFKSRPVKHNASITDPERVGDLLRAIDGYTGYPATRCALRLLPMVFVRPGELRNAEWSEFDLDAAEWSIPAGRMKMREPHLVPLSRQAVAILRELKLISGRNRLAFPGVRHHDKPMSENTLNAALRYIGYDKDTMSSHGFRAMARTLLDEKLRMRIDLIEHQLAHTVRDALGRAYNRTQFLSERREMMQAWADYLDELAKRAKVVPITRKVVTP